MKEILDINPIVYLIFFFIMYTTHTKPKQGGLIRAIQQQTFWLILLSVFVILSSIKIYYIKRNYTELHRKVMENKKEILWIKTQIKK